MNGVCNKIIDFFPFVLSLSKHKKIIREQFIELCVPYPYRDEQKDGGIMIIDDIAQMIGKKVEVVAHEITYTGILMEVSEEEINLKGEFQWIGIPIENVVSIRPVSV